MGDRHQFRAKWHDYNGGIYFVTICSHEKKHIFGSITDAIFSASKIGEIVNYCISQIPTVHPNTEVWNYVIMPNHIHLVLSVGAQYIAPASAPPASARPASARPTSVGAQYIAPASAPPASAPVSPEYITQQTASRNTGCLKGPMHGDPVIDNHFNSSLAVVIRTFKAAVTRTARAQCIAPLQVWQRNFHDHIIRNQHALDNIMNYIDSNVANWEKDCFAQ